MAVTPKQMYLNTPGTSSATAYTVPAATTAILKNILITNITASPAALTIQVGGKDILSGYTVDAKDTVSLDFSLVMNTGQIIAVSQVTASALNVTISGMEVT